MIKCLIWSNVIFEICICNILSSLVLFKTESYEIGNTWKYLERASRHSPGFHHLLDYLVYLYHSLWFLLQVLLFLFHVCALFRISWFVILFNFFIKYSLPELASRLLAHTLHTGSHERRCSTLCLPQSADQPAATLR
jgi:hypothetical protein